MENSIFETKKYLMTVREFQFIREGAGLSRRKLGLKVPELIGRDSEYSTSAIYEWELKNWPFKIMKPFQIVLLQGSIMPELYIHLRYQFKIMIENEYAKEEISKESRDKYLFKGVEND